MLNRVTASFGTWISPVEASLIASSSISLSNLQVLDGALYWQEMRPVEGGRTVLVRRSADGVIADLTPPPLDLGSRVHEYGGGGYALSPAQIVIGDRRDGGVRSIELRADGTVGAIRLVAQVPDLRFADFSINPRLNRVVCVREDHRADGPPVNAIVSLDLSGVLAPADNTGRILAEGHDFYMAPRLSPTGSRLAFLAWDHPAMPWDGARLFVAPLEPDDAAGPPSPVAVSSGAIVAQPRFSAEGILYCVAEQNGWANPCIWDEATDRLMPLIDDTADYAQPAWIFGRADWVFLPDGGLSCLSVRDGIFHQAILRDGALIALGDGASTPRLPVGLDWGQDGQAWIAHTPFAPPEIVLEAGAVRKVIRRSMAIELPAEVISVGEPIIFPTLDGTPGHAFFYAPKNPGFAAPDGQLPPLVVYSHGGPTGMATRGFNAGIQFWTSRGFAVVDVNYGGSAGFGAAYRRRLDGRWGIVDVADCEAAVVALIERGLVDRDRVAIRGNSAGGYTTLAALAFTDRFKAGASYYGVGDLATLARDTHKFEARYLDGLVGRWPQDEAIYRARSPIHHLDRLTCPVIFFQGEDDRIVPPNQAADMVAAMRARGLAAAYYTFEGEGHGFRKAETIRRTLELELSFYGAVFGFTPAGAIETALLA